MDTTEPDLKPIQLFVPFFRKDECLQEMATCLDVGWTGLGFKTVEIEQAWKDYSGLGEAHFVNSATAALHLAVEVLKTKLGWSDGDEVITTPLTFVSTNHVILEAGLKPVFADVDEYLCLSPESVERAITPRTRAVMFVGLGGNVGRLTDIVRICQEHNVKLILDAAHMAGTKLDDRDPGHLADVACYSFQAVKNLPTADSGMVCFRDPEFDALARKLSWLGISKDTYARSNQGTYAWKYDVDYVGYKYNGSSIMAALALVGLRYLDEDNARRREICAWYDEALAGYSFVERVPTHSSCVSSRHLYQVILRDRDLAMSVLHEHKVYPGVHYRDNTEYPMYAYGQGSCPNAAHASQHLLSLPLHVQLSASDVARVVEAIADYGSRLSDAS